MTDSYEHSSNEYLNANKILLGDLLAFVSCVFLLLLLLNFFLREGQKCLKWKQKQRLPMLPMASNIMNPGQGGKKVQ